MAIYQYQNQEVIWGSVPDSGPGNVVLGYRAGALLVEPGVSNTALGHKALEENETGASNTAVGEFALFKTLENANTAVGYSCCANMAEGKENTALGYNTSIGSKSSNNTVIGAKAELGEKSKGCIAIGGGHSGEQKEKLFIHNENTLTPLIGGVFTEGAEALTFNAAVLVAKTLKVTEELKAEAAIVAKTTLKVAGESKLEGAVVASKTLKVEELTTAKGGLTVEGTLTLPNESVKQNYIQGSLTKMWTPVRELAQL